MDEEEGKKEEIQQTDKSNVSPDKAEGKFNIKKIKYSIYICIDYLVTIIQNPAL